MALGIYERQQKNGPSVRCMQPPPFLREDRRHFAHWGARCSPVRGREGRLSSSESLVRRAFSMWPHGADFCAATEREVMSLPRLCTPEKIKGENAALWTLELPL